MARALLVLLAAALGPPGPLLAFDISQCIAPLGMESGQIADRDLSASSSFHDGNVGPQNGRLNQEIKGGAWCPMAQITTESTEWLEVALGGVHVVTAVGTQGRFGNGQGREYAEAYVLEYWRPRLNKWVRYRTAAGDEVMTGNTNTYLEKKNQLEPAIWATRVRIIPHSAHRRTVCLRVELYGCPWTEGIVAYSMPRGDKRSNGVELTDSWYDGEWGEQLRGGLGRLVDGRFGGDEIREANRAPAWVGWRADSPLIKPQHALQSLEENTTEDPAAVVIVFEFDRVREFGALHLHCSNRFMRDVQVFSEVVVSFSVGGQHFQSEAVRLSPEPDHIFESSRNVSVSLRHRIGRWVRLRLHFAARWMLLSEIVFESDVAQGNYSAEKHKSVDGTSVATGGAATNKDTDGLTVTESPVSTARAQDPLTVALGVGVLTALAILLAGGAFLALQRHRHRKCFASPPPAPHAHTAPPGRLLPPPVCDLDYKPDDYQEPYQALKCAPYFTYSTVLLEMKDFVGDSNTALSDSSNYEYAVPEVSSEPLLSRTPAPPAPPSRPPSARSDSRPTSRLEAVTELRRRLEGSVPEFPRHRLRMISKLAEGAFGTVYVAEADGVPEYDGTITAERRLVAVKFLTHDASEKEREQFMRDVRVLAALSHSGLARVVGVCRAPPLCVVLEYLETDLWRALREQGPLPPRTAARVALQLAAGMRYLETLSFVHRDLAARNCLVGANYQIKISDFGTDNEAYASDYYRAEGAEPLPLRWAAWEVALRGRHSTRSDVWAFGVTLCELYGAARRRIYHQFSDLQVLENLSHLEADDGLWTPPAVPAALPAGLAPALAACWRRAPLDRPSFHHLHQLLLTLDHDYHCYDQSPG